MVKKEISLVENWKEALWETVLCCVNSSHRDTWFISWISLVALLLWCLRKDILECMEADGGKGNILRQKLESSFLRNSFMIFEFIYMILFMEQFANTIFVESAKGYSRVHCGHWWKRNYPQTKSRKKLFEKLLCDLWIHLTDLHLSFHRVVW